MTTTTARTLCATNISRSRSTLRQKISLAFAVARQRNALSRLDDFRLNDLGITPSEAAREIRRSFWDVRKA